MKKQNVWAVAAAAAAVIGTGASAQLLGAQSGASMLTDDGVRVQVFGRVRSADANSFVLVVKNMTYRVQATRRNVTSRQDVHEGDRVRVFGDLIAQDRIDAGQVQIVERAAAEEQATSEGVPRRGITGTIKEIDRQSGRMVLTVPAGNLRVQMDGDTIYMRGGQAARLSEFRIGESVRVVGERSAPNAIAARRVVFGDAQTQTQTQARTWTSGATGEIVSLDNRTKEIEIDFDGDVYTVKAVNAAIRHTDKQSIQFDDLRLEHQVRVYGTVRGAKTIEATRIEAIRPRGRTER